MAPTYVPRLKPMRERVLDGIKFLDAKKPGWRLAVQEPLNMSGARSCLLAQVFHTSYWGAARGLFGNDMDFGPLGDDPFIDSSRALGFETDQYQAEDYYELTRVWVELAKLPNPDPSLSAKRTLSNG